VAAALREPTLSLLKRGRLEKNYDKRSQLYQKHIWANTDLYGPAFSFTYKDEHHFGFFTRSRQLYRGGNITSSELAVLGEELSENYYGADIKFKDTGFTIHSFSEVGITYGRVLRDDNFHIARGGVTLKYLMGFVAGSLHTQNLTYNQGSADTIDKIKGDLTALYTYNISSFIDNNVQNDMSAWFQRAGRWGIGFDIGGQYEYHPNGTPNEPTPYMFSIAASITDIGGIAYIADTGSGRYDLNVANINTGRWIKQSYEDPGVYFLRVQEDTNISMKATENVQKFRVGLPTAFRVNADYNATENINFAVNLLLNLKGTNGGVYKPAYVNYLNFTPSYYSKNVRIGLPFTISGYQTFSIGLTFRWGPLYIGSTSAITTLMTTRINTLDAYAGLALKLFKKNERHYY
jgi:hypothetical protein